MSELINKSKLKSYIKEKKEDAQVDPELAETLEAEVYDMVGKAISRAEENGRKTVRTYDI